MADFGKLNGPGRLQPPRTSAAAPGARRSTVRRTEPAPAASHTTADETDILDQGHHEPTQQTPVRARPQGAQGAMAVPHPANPLAARRGVARPAASAAPRAAREDGPLLFSRAQTRLGAVLADPGFAAASDQQQQATRAIKTLLQRGTARGALTGPESTELSQLLAQAGLSHDATLMSAAQVVRPSTPATELSADPFAALAQIKEEEHQEHTREAAPHAEVVAHADPVVAQNQTAKSRDAHIEHDVSSHQSDIESRSQENKRRLAELSQNREAVSHKSLQKALLQKLDRAAARGDTLADEALRGEKD